MDQEIVNTEVQETQTTPEVTTTPPATNETPAVTATPAQGNETATPAVEATPAWAADFKFKIKDKELEFDDFVKPIIKSKEVNDKIKDLYLKAHGLEEVKASRDHFQKSFKAEQDRFVTIEKNLQNLGGYVKNKDFRTFFDILKIDKNDVINYAIEELKFQELPPEQKQAIERQRQQQVDYNSQVAQNQAMQTQMQQLVMQQTQFELNQAFSAPDIAPAISQFDARAGQAGAFQAEVLRRGQYYEAVHKTSPPARQLVQEVLTLAGLSSGMPGQAQQAPLQQGNVSQVVHNQQQKPVIPSFSGGSSTKSPARQVVGTIDDIRKRRQELLQNQS